MAGSPTHDTATVVLHDVPRAVYEGLAAALPARAFPHVYREGVLQIESPVLSGISLAPYQAALDALGDRRFPHTYREGELEIMSPPEEHEWLKEFIGRLIEMAAFELDVAIRCIGSTTLRHPDLPHGLEPDLSVLRAGPRSRAGAPN